jgi:hypothetical protein
MDMNVLRMMLRLLLNVVFMVNQQLFMRNVKVNFQLSEKILFQNLKKLNDTLILLDMCL